MTWMWNWRDCWAYGFRWNCDAERWARDKQVVIKSWSIHLGPLELRVLQ